MIPHRGHSLLALAALFLVSGCVAGAVWMASAFGPGADIGSARQPAVSVGSPADDLLIDFTGRAVNSPVPWRVEGRLDAVRRTARGLLIIARSGEDPPKIVLDLDVPEESIGAVEVTMALNKGSRGTIWGSRYAGEPPGPGRTRHFPLQPGLGARTYRVELGAGDTRGAPLHSLTIQLTDAPVRASVRGIRLVRTSGWKSFVACSEGEERMVVMGGIGVSAVPVPEDGLLVAEAAVPEDNPRLQLVQGVHPLQKLLGRTSIEFRVRVEPLPRDGTIAPVATPVHRRLVDPGVENERLWHFDTVDLAPWAGRTLRISLETLTWRRVGDGPERLLPGRPSWSLPLWGPVAISSGTGPSRGVVLVLLDGVGQGEMSGFADPGHIPAVLRHLSGAAFIDDVYAVAYGRDRFLRSFYHADYLDPLGVQQAAAVGSLALRAREEGFRTAVFYSGSKAEGLLEDWQLNTGFEFAGRSEFELGLPPEAGRAWSPDNPLLDQLGPLSWIDRLGCEPFMLVVHLDSGAFKSASRVTRLAEVDAAMDRLFGHLARRGLLERSVVCVAGFRAPVRSARVDRGCRLWDESMKIPLVIGVPGGLADAAGNERIFRSIDILPTLFELAGMSTDHRQGAGLSLASWLRGESAEAWPVQEVFLCQQRKGRRYIGLRKGPYKLIWRTGPRRPAACYDLAADPDERFDISPTGRSTPTLGTAGPLERQVYDDLVRRLESHFGP